MSISGFFQFIIGFIIGTIFFAAGIGGGIYFFLTTMSVNPSKPVFSEEKQEEANKNQPSQANNNVNNQSSNTNQNTNSQPSKEEENLPAGAFRARVTWSTGLSLRAEPNKDAERTGGIGYNSEIIILSQSNDKQWQKVRIPGSGEEGWIKAGNIEKVE